MGPTLEKNSASFQRYISIKTQENQIFLFPRPYYTNNLEKLHIKKFYTQNTIISIIHHQHFNLIHLISFGLPVYSSLLPASLCCPLEGVHGRHHHHPPSQTRRHRHHDPLPNLAVLPSLESSLAASTSLKPAAPPSRPHPSSCAACALDITSHSALSSFPSRYLLGKLFFKPSSAVNSFPATLPDASSRPPKCPSLLEAEIRA